MTSLNRLLRSLSEQEQLDALRFRPQAEALEAREVPSGNPIDIGLTKTVADMCYSPGAVATYHYVVTNPGVVTLDHVVLKDDLGIPNNSSPLTITPGVNGVTAIDDGGTPLDTSDDAPVMAGDRLFAGHSWAYTANITLPNVTANTTVTNIATVTATPLVEGVSDVSATASASVMICVPTTPPKPLSHGDTATIGFWNNKNGQALINSVNGGSTSTNLATWLATNFPNLYGAGAGANNLTGKTNADVAALFQKDFGVKGAKSDAQVLAGALAVYMTDFDLAGGAAVKYGFTVTTTGTGDKTYNVGSLGTAIGLQNNTEYTVLQLLQQADIDKANGTYNAGAFNSIFDGINQKGDIK